MATPSGQPKPGVTSQKATKSFPRGGSLPKGQNSPGTQRTSAAKERVIGGRLIEGQNLRGYVAAGSANLPTEDGNMRPDGSERTVREIPAP